MIVGVNKFKLAKEDPVDILDIDNVAVRENQIKRLKAVKASRDSARSRRRSGADRRGVRRAATRLALSIDAMRRAPPSVKCPTRWRRSGAGIRHSQEVTGVYAAAYDSAEGWDKLKKEIDAFAPSRAAARA